MSKVRADRQVDPLPQGADRDEDGGVEAAAAVAVVRQQTLQLPHALLVDAHQRRALVVLKIQFFFNFFIRKKKTNSHHKETSPHPCTQHRCGLWRFGRCSASLSCNRWCRSLAPAGSADTVAACRHLKN